jgi:uncharacterized protein (TIGR02270 family)
MISPDRSSGYVLGDPARMQDPARIGRNALEMAIADLANVPIEIDARVLELLPKAIATLYVALDTAPEEPAHADALHEAIATLDEALALLSRAHDGTPRAAVLDRPRGIVSDVRSLLARRADEVFEIQLQARGERRFSFIPGETEASKQRPFRASVALPRMHALTRPRLSVEIERAPLAKAPSASPKPTIERPKDLAALQAFAASASSGELAKQLAEPEEDEEPPPPPPVTFAFEVAIEERDALRTLARDTLEDIGSLGNLRVPIPTETWLDQAPFEQRLLDNIDYFASLGGACLPLVTLYHKEAEVPDAMRAFAVAFTLGCIEGSDTIGTAISVLKRSAPEEWSGFVDGFVLAPHSGIDQQLPELLVHPNPKLAAVALEVLGKRGSLPDDVIEWTRPRNDPGLTLALVRALASNLSRDTALPYLDELLFSEIDDELWLAAATSAIRRGHGRARDRIRDMLRAPPSLARAEGGIHLLGLAGHPRDMELLGYAARTYPTSKVARALGRFGHASSIPLLIELLAIEAVAEAAGESLDRVTAAGLREVVEEPWDTGLPPELREAAEAQGAPIPMRKVEKVILDPARWTAWFRENHARFDARKKYRGGVPFAPIHVLDELEAKSTPVARREEATFELACILRDVLRFSPSDWVARQKTQLAELRTVIPPSEGGDWWFGGAPARAD